MLWLFLFVRDEPTEFCTNVCTGRKPGRGQRVGSRCKAYTPGQDVVHRKKSAQCGREVSSQATRRYWFVYISKWQMGTESTFCLKANLLLWCTETPSALSVRLGQSSTYELKEVRDMLMNAGCESKNHWKFIQGLDPPLQHLYSVLRKWSWFKTNWRWRLNHPRTVLYSHRV